MTRYEDSHMVTISCLCYLDPVHVMKNETDELPPDLHADRASFHTFRLHVYRCKCLDGLPPLRAMYAAEHKQRQEAIRAQLDEKKRHEKALEIKKSIQKKRLQENMKNKKLLKKQNTHDEMSLIANLGDLTLNEPKKSTETTLIEGLGGLTLAESKEPK